MRWKENREFFCLEFGGGGGGAAPSAFQTLKARPFTMAGRQAACTGKAGRSLQGCFQNNQTLRICNVLCMCRADMNEMGAGLSSLGFDKAQKEHAENNSARFSSGRLRFGICMI